MIEQNVLGHDWGDSYNSVCICQYLSNFAITCKLYLKKQSRFLNIEQVSDNRAKVGERNRAGNTQKTSPHFLKRKTKGQV